MNEYMKVAIDEAKKSLDEGGIPIGSVIVYKNKIIGRGHNQRIQRGSVVLHAEMAALENAGRLKSFIYKECTLYTTLSPCSMCSGAILLYGISHVVIGENKTYIGEEKLLTSRGVAVEVLEDETCMELMGKFINNNQDLWNEDIGE